MKQRIFTGFVVVIISTNFVLNLFNDELKQDLAQKITYAINYYTEQAWYYYGRATGQIPPDIIVKNEREWRQFEFVRDAFLLESKQAENMFTAYIQAKNEAFQAIKPKKERTEGKTRPPRHGLFNRWDEMTASIYTDTLKGQLTPGELAVLRQIVVARWLYPDAGLRALRHVDLTDGQREILKPLSIQLVKTQITDFSPWNGRNGFEQNGQEIETVKNDFVEKVKETLSQKQENKWLTSIPKEQETIDEYIGRDDFRRLSFQRRDRRPGRFRDQEQQVDG